MSDRYEFPPLEEYILDHRCSWCRAEPGENCNLKRPAPHQFAHAVRIDAGLAHYTRDAARTMPHERVPGGRYDSISNRKET